MDRNLPTVAAVHSKTWQSELDSSSDLPKYKHDNILQSQAQQISCWDKCIITK